MNSRGGLCSTLGSAPTPLAPTPLAPTHSNSRLGGTLPSAWSALGSSLHAHGDGLRTLALYNMSLSGTLPAAWAKLNNLRSLYLHENSFRGSIPDKWPQNMKSLQVFAAQRNQLQGTIPLALLNSSAMCILLLSDNRLQGRISHVSSSFKRPECIVTTDSTTSSSFRPALLLHNNRLSCALPRHFSRGNARDPGTDERWL